MVHGVAVVDNDDGPTDAVVAVSWLQHVRSNDADNNNDNKYNGTKNNSNNNNNTKKERKKEKKKKKKKDNDDDDDDGDDDSNDDDDDDDDNDIERLSLRLFTMPSLTLELSPTRQLKWPGHDREQIRCKYVRCLSCATFSVPRERWMMMIMMMRRRIIMIIK